MAVEIFGVDKNSLAERAGIKPHDKLISINGHDITDILDFRFYETNTHLHVVYETAEGERREEKFVKPQYGALGLAFETYLMDRQRSCRNKCVFCFIDQLPPGMRETLYFKDDDDRLSFLFGNYITLTNIDEREIDRIIEMRISPINISVHTMNPTLRCKMMHNRFAGDALRFVRKLAEHNIKLNCQIVLCPGLNDGEELEFTLSEMYALGESLQSVACVPVGVTRYREGLCRLEPFTRESSIATVRQVEAHQRKILAEHGTRFVHLSDEFYLNAGLEIPDAGCYEGFPQIENGVGLIASMREEFDEAIGRVPRRKFSRRIAIATGELAAPFIGSLAARVEKAAPGVTVTVYAVKNDFFGGGVNVAGLVCACDIIKTIGDTSGFDELLIPDSMLRDGEDIFLDDITLCGLSETLRVKITPVPNDGYAFIESIIGCELEF